MKDVVLDDVPPTAEVQAIVSAVGEHAILDRVVRRVVVVARAEADRAVVVDVGFGPGIRQIELPVLGEDAMVEPVVGRAVGLCRGFRPAGIADRIIETARIERARGDLVVVRVRTDVIEARAVQEPYPDDLDPAFAGQDESPTPVIVVRDREHDVFGPVGRKDDRTPLQAGIRGLQSVRICAAAEIDGVTCRGVGIGRGDGAAG